MGLPAAKEPHGWRNWKRKPARTIDGIYQLVFRRGPLWVLSSVREMDFRGVLRPQWLVSVSARADAPARDVLSNPERYRATDEEVAIVRADFGMERAEEDNHQPGCARMLFLLCDARPEDPAQCECKETEEVITEPDGFTWSRERTK